MKKITMVVAVILGLAIIQPVQASQINTIAIIDTAIDSSKNSNVVYEACFTLATCPNGTSFQEGPGSANVKDWKICLLYTSPSPRDRQKSRMPSSA